MTANAGHIFVSHSSDNRQLASELAGFLEVRGIRVWIAPRDVRPGMDYSEQLQLAIENAAAFVVLVTDMANKSPYVRAETEMAFSNHKPLFPVRLADIQPAAGLALFLKIRHWTDAYGKSKSANLDRLARELQTLSGAEVTAPPVTTPPSAAPAAPMMAAAAAAPAAAAAAPRPAARAPAPMPANAEEEERWRAAVGPKADLYLERWKQMAEKNSAMSWNWAACLANLFWFAYRKMWLFAGAMALVYLLNVALMTNPQAAKVVGLIGIAITFVTGTFGNHWYRQQTAKLVATTAGQDQASAVETLRQRGGVSQPALYGAIGGVVVLVLIVFAIAVRQAQQNLAPVGPVDTFNTFGDNGMQQDNGDKPPPPPEDPNAPPEPPVDYQEGY